MLSDVADLLCSGRQRGVHSLCGRRVLQELEQKQPIPWHPLKYELIRGK